MSDAVNPAVPTKPSAASTTEGDASSTGIAATIERLRRHRVRRPRHSELGHVLTAIRREATRQQKRRGGLDEIWEEIAPQALHDRTRVDSVRSGIVRLVVADPSTRYEVDAFLRGGGLQELRLRAGQPIRQVRCEIAPLDAAGVRS